MDLKLSKVVFFWVFVVSRFRECLPRDAMQCGATADGSVNIQCTIQSERDVSQDVLEWTKDGTDVHARRAGVDDLAGQHRSYEGRTKLVVEKMDKGKWNISFQLSNVTKEDEGNYTFTVRNTTLTSTVTVTLDEPKDPGKTKGSATVGVGVGVGVGVVGVGGLILIGVIMYCYRKKKKTETRQAENENIEEAQNVAPAAQRRPKPRAPRADALSEELLEIRTNPCS